MKRIQHDETPLKDTKNEFDGGAWNFLPDTFTKYILFPR